MVGTIKALLTDCGFAFIHAADGRDYYFHRSDLRGGLGFSQLVEGLRVTFKPGAEPLWALSGGQVQRPARRVCLGGGD